MTSAGMSGTTRVNNTAAPTACDARVGRTCDGTFLKSLFSTLMSRMADRFGYLAMIITEARGEALLGIACVWSAILLENGIGLDPKAG